MALPSMLLGTTSGRWRSVIGLEDDEHRCGLVLAEAESVGGVGAALAKGGRRLARSPQGFEPGGADECDHIVHGKTPQKPAKKPEDFPSLSRPKPLSLRLENGLLQHRTRVRAPQSHRKKPRLGFFPFS